MKRMICCLLACLMLLPALADESAPLLPDAVFHETMLDEPVTCWCYKGFAPEDVGYELMDVMVWLRKGSDDDHGSMEVSVSVIWPGDESSIAMDGWRVYAGEECIAECGVLSQYPRKDKALVDVSFNGQAECAVPVEMLVIMPVFDGVEAAEQAIILLLS